MVCYRLTDTNIVKLKAINDNWSYTDYRSILGIDQLSVNTGYRPIIGQYWVSANYRPIIGQYWVSTNYRSILGIGPLSANLPIISISQLLIYTIGID